MTLTDRPLLLFALILIGIVGQLALAWLKSRSAAPYRAGQVVLVLFWLALGMVLLVGAWALFGSGETLLALANLALGVGLGVSGVGRALESKVLGTVGVVCLALGPLSVGAYGLVTGQALTGAVSLLIGVGLLLTVLKPPAGSIGQVWMGAVILLSSGLLFLAPWFETRQLVLDGTLLISLVLALMGVVVIVAGVRGIVKGGRKMVKEAG
jgi:hypothetical protein